MKKIGFIGLGVMGYPMAGHLHRKGHTVTVYNRTVHKAEKWAAEYQGEYVEDYISMVSDLDVLILCVGNDDDVRDIVQKAYSEMKAGSMIVDHTTTSATVAQELASLVRENGIEFLDAPVSGGQVGAEKGLLTTMVGGELKAYEQVEELLACYSKKVTYMGEAGNGQRTKMVNQICIAGLVQGLAEGISFAKNAGLDAHKVIEVISQGAAGSWQMENRSETMIEGKFDFGFAVSLMRKDLGIVLDEARRNQSELPVTAIVDQFYARLEKIGHERSDTSSLIVLLEEKNRTE